MHPDKTVRIYFEDVGQDLVPNIHLTAVECGSEGVSGEGLSANRPADFEQPPQIHPAMLVLQKRGDCCIKVLLSEALGFAGLTKLRPVLHIIF